MGGVLLAAPGCTLAVLALALAALALRLRTPLGRFGIVVTALATAVVHGGYAASALWPEHLSSLLAASFMASLVQSVAILDFAQDALLQLTGKKHSHGRRVGLLLAAILVGGCMYLPGAVELNIAPAALGKTQVVHHLASVGQLAYGALLASLLLAIAKLEQLLRRVRDPLRYQLKFVILGLGMLALVNVYVSSVLLLQRAWDPQFALVHSAVSLFGLALFCVGLFRMRHESSWPALTEPTGAYGSLSFLIVGAYLLSMGVLSALLPAGGSTPHYVLGMTVASAATVALAVLLASRSVRTALLQQFVRTFKQSKHDYRRKWLEVAEAFHDMHGVDAIVQRFLDLLGASFRATRISIWMPSSTDGRYHQQKSINFEAPPAPLSWEHPVVRAVLDSPQIVRVEELKNAALGEAQREPDSGDVNPPDGGDFYQSTRAQLIAPLWADEALGFVALSHSVEGAGFDQDDVDLLHAMCNHVGVLLAHAQLAEEQRAGEKIRAFHEFSMFCIHDLKNLAGRLSLVAQNAKRFGDSPEFQASALRTVSTTVERTTALINKLSSGFDVEATQPRATAALVEHSDLFEALSVASATMRQGVRVVLPPRPTESVVVQLGKEALTSALLNVITNAEQALGDVGEITIEVQPKEAEYVVQVCDDGPGIPPAVLADLFRPLRSTKKSGFGVGLYQCRRTLRGVGGDITVDSTQGVGTRVTLRLPAASPTIHQSTA